MGAPDARNAEDELAGLSEQPLVLPLLRRILGIGEFVEAIGNDQASVRRELAAFRPEVVDRPLVLARLAPAPLNQFGFSWFTRHAADNRTEIGDLDIIAGLQIRNALTEAYRDLKVGKLLDGRPDVGL